MPAFKKIWNCVTPTANSLPQWQLIMQDIHDHLILAGWEQTATAGQIADISSVSTYPTRDQETHFRVYKLNDGHGELHGDIFMKVTFSAYRLGYFNSVHLPLCPGTKIQVSKDTVFDDATTLTCRLPTGSRHSGTSASHTALSTSSIICSNPDLGFFGFVYGPGSLTYGENYAGAPFSIIIQRILNDDLTIADGFVVYGVHQLSELSSLSGTIGASKEALHSAMKVISPSFNNSSPVNNHSPRPFGTNVTAMAGGSVQVAPVYYAMPQIKQCPTLCSYLDAQITAGTQFEVQAPHGEIFNFVSLGHCGLTAGDSSSYAMLYQ